MRRLMFLLLLLLGCSSPADRTNSIAADPTDAAVTDDPFSPSEKDAVRRQIEKNWLIDLGLPDLETMEAAIIVELNPDGSVQSARFDPASARDDPNWKRFAEACRRAIFRASPLRMPLDKPYAAWKTITLQFSWRGPDEVELN